ncbi:nuclear transport factor 2 family protein [Mucilaginibacter auburnensis]|uniref:Putative lumazine-binding protein n=1 Tax=Mucilaginibacter auburnensis TaxID=1457233 RepID=A0A2H9VP82_9SPHI|nr:nuclear transport factor 2 family protein [Mucilaginibacter auburnensis]PJJ80136.1 putative lumazine-binding protein [Mucilaginibacter auburnensis]
MKKLALTLLLFTLCHTGFAQQADVAAIKQTINNMFDAMRKTDSTLLRSTFAKGIILHSIGKTKDGTTVLINDSADDFVKSIGMPHKGIYDERITFKDIKIDGELASVWAPYKFYLDDKFSHCGVDVFQLMKTAAGWKIIYIVDTRRKDGCSVM